ncbi:MAG TPA: hypothetical protein PLB01_18120 [Thermoanaerobaculia bacterium]|nr:hypothetical protein [Thermoanaerobaculia bacterium]
MNATAIGLTVGIALLGLLVILIGIFPSPEDPAGRPPGRKQIEKVLLRLRRDPVFHESFAGRRLSATPRVVRLTPSKKKSSETS